MPHDRRHHPAAVLSLQHSDAHLVTIALRLHAADLRGRAERLRVRPLADSYLILAERAERIVDSLTIAAH